MKDYFNHDKNTKLNAIILLQRKVLQKQLDAYQKAAGESRSHELGDNCVSPLLLQRFQVYKRIADDFELAVLGLLDENGQLSSVTRLQDFMFLMTRVTKVTLLSVSVVI
jgi:hypothetical protein